MKIIGLTGGIGSGKSTVAGYLAELGATIIDTDKLGHEAFRPDTHAWREVVAVFGPQILLPNDEIDRKKLGEIVFHDQTRLSMLNEIMHHRILQMVKRKFAEYRKQNVKVVVLEATLMIEGGWSSLVDEIWVTLAPEEKITKRVKERSGLSTEEVRARIKSQIPPEKRIKFADVVINTDCTLDELKARVAEIWQQRNSPAKAK